MIRIAVCDDDNTFCGVLIQTLETLLVGRKYVIDDFSNGLELCQAIQNEHELYDLFILDIEMPKMNGIDAGFAIRRIPALKNSMIVYMTSYDSDITAIVDTHPYAYIKKNFSNQEFTCRLSDCLKALSCDKPVYLIKNRADTYPVSLLEITHIQSSGRHTLFFLESGEIVESSMPLTKSYESLLERSVSFIQTGKSDIINIRYVKALAAASVLLTTGEQIPLSSKYKNAVLEKFTSSQLH